MAAENRGGSSPRVRGTARIGVVLGSDQRFIPARAGNSDGEAIRNQVRAVHPRACGEQPARVCAARRIAGSSPRVRGTGDFARLDDDPNRFIPARAGNRFRRSYVTLASSVHPRACGEQALMAATRALMTGSSPRVRGTVTSANAHRPPLRFIPARAGNSAAWCEAMTTNSVHPRACGEQIG